MVEVEVEAVVIIWWLPMEVVILVKMEVRGNTGGGCRGSGTVVVTGVEEAVVE